MKTRRFLIIFWTVCFLGKIAAAETRGLELVASCVRDRDGQKRDPQAEGAGEYRYFFRILFKNTSGSPMTIVKGEIGKHTAAMEGEQFTLSTIYAFSRTAFGDWNIPAESELGAVKLLPGDAAEVHIAIRTDARVDETAWTVEYKISPELAKRFGTWEGEVKTATVTHHQLDELSRLRAK